MTEEQATFLLGFISQLREQTQTTREAATDFMQQVSSDRLLRALDAFEQIIKAHRGQDDNPWQNPTLASILDALGLDPQS